MRRNIRKKACLYILVAAALIYFIMSLRKTRNEYNSFYVRPQYYIKNPNLKYILQWSSPNNVPFIYMGIGRNVFIERACPYTNCVVTSNKHYFDNYTKFDVIAFHGPEIGDDSFFDLPSMRSPHQKFVFASIESPDNYPVCSPELDNFFNWTWTYKLTSDARWGYIVVRDSNKKMIGPNVEMHWLKKEEMTPVSEEFKEQLNTKTRAAAWFVSNCHTKSGREIFVMMLQRKLKEYGLTVDVYGRCGTLSCPSENQNECKKIIREDYYFYLAFENSYEEDYVTEKILLPLQNNAVPIVYGGANYTR